LLGHVANPYQYLSRSAFLISASENEGFSLVIVEALTLGIPVVSTDCAGGPREILAGEAPAGNATGQVGLAPYGLMVNVHDTIGLAKAMELVLNDQSVRQRYAAKGKKRARMYDKGLSADRYMEYMHQLMGAH
jgi:N-acetylgalactosamine-N,N'-diacetylbacillosaminyl-diphospho-undecaprenol 4-alpha-N-acetylgalactosaminyltransferase